MLNVLFFLTFSAISVGSVPLWRNAVTRKRAGERILDAREMSGSPFGFIDVVGTFSFWFGAQIVSSFLALYVLGLESGKLDEATGSQLAWFSIVAGMNLLVATIAAMALLYLRYLRFSILGLQTSNLSQDLMIGVVAFVMVIPGILGLQWLLTMLVEYKHSTMEMVANDSSLLTVGAAWFSAVLVAPICEEVFFRGILQAWLQRLTLVRHNQSDQILSDRVLFGGWDSVPHETTEAGDHAVEPVTTVTATIDSESSWLTDSYWPILLSAALFGLAHAGQGPAPIPLFVFGLVLGYLYRKTGSIIPCIVLHMLLNAFSMFWFTLQVLFADSESASILQPRILNELGVMIGRLF